MTRRTGWRSAVVLTTAIVTTAPLGAQNSNLQSPPPSSPSQPTATGWLLIPSLSLSSAWDDNVFVEGQGSNPQADLVNVVNPRIESTYTGRLSVVTLDYSGAFLLYRDLNALNSYDQHASFSARRRLTKRLSFFVSNTFAAVPTTELAELVGVPFVRTGSTLDDAQAGVETALSKRATLSVAYDFQYVAFGEDPTFATVLHGGHGQGVTTSYRYRLSERTSVLADYRLQHAEVAETNEIFTVQTGGVGLERRLTEVISAYAEIGIARLDTTSLADQTRTGPAVRAGLTRRTQKSDFEAAYSRTFVPSYGFGGTTQNEEFTASLYVPFSRRLYGRAGTALRRNEPLTPGVPPLRSFWLEGSFGYTVNPSVRVEAIYGGAHQEVDRPGGIINRNRYGVQVVTTKPLRIH
jgi:hypothetical protein